LVRECRQPTSSIPDRDPGSTGIFSRNISFPASLAKCKLRLPHMTAFALLR
jgi:hypothetical protein